MRKLARGQADRDLPLRIILERALRIDQSFRLAGGLKLLVHRAAQVSLLERRDRLGEHILDDLAALAVCGDQGSFHPEALQIGARRLPQELLAVVFEEAQQDARLPQALH